MPLILFITHITCKLKKKNEPLVFSPICPEESGNFYIKKFLEAEKSNHNNT